MFCGKIQGQELSKIKGTDNILRKNSVDRGTGLYTPLANTWILSILSISLVNDVCRAVV